MDWMYHDALVLHTCVSHVLTLNPTRVRACVPPSCERLLFTQVLVKSA
jgi:hypothetical protein